MEESMDLDKIYFDSGNRACSILGMVSREPKWAAERIQEGEAAAQKVEQLRIERAAFEGRLAIAEKVISDHNQAMQNLCDWMAANRGCVAYRSRGRTCPDCPLDHQIDYQGVESQ